MKPEKNILKTVEVIKFITLESDIEVLQAFNKIIEIRLEQLRNL